MALQLYLSALFDKIQPPISSVKDVKPTDYTLSNTNYTTLYQYKFTTAELKAHAKAIKIKITGVKKEVLCKRLYFYYLLQTKASQIQRIFRGYLLRKLLQIQGNIARNRKRCINTTDVVTLEDIEEIPADYFYCYCDDNKGEMYGFNVASLYTLLEARGMGSPVLNPYNRLPFRETIKQEVAYFIKLSRITGRATIKLAMDNVINSCTTKQQIELKALGIFQLINELGNYSDARWFLDLSRGETLKYMGEFYDIWNHRAGLTSQMKKELCPPDGVLFRHPRTHLAREHDIYKLKTELLTLFERLVSHTAITIDNKRLNAMYILAALTLVSPNAAEAMPTYYFSVI